MMTNIINCDVKLKKKKTLKSIKKLFIVKMLNLCGFETF